MLSKKQIENERRKQNLSEKNIKLVIAEKPSVAQSIAKVKGKYTSAYFCAIV